MITNILVWIFGRPETIHIGASGVIYGLAGFLTVYGFLRRDFMSIIISLVVFGLYGYLIYGIFPTYSHVSFEAHLAGAIVGVVSAFQLRKVSAIN